MDRTFKLIVGLIIVCGILIAFRFFEYNISDRYLELIPGVTDDKTFKRIDSNSSIGQYILSSSFKEQVSGIHIQSKSSLFGTNETSGNDLFDECCWSLERIGFYEISTTRLSKEGKYSGIFANETRKRIFNIFEGNDVEEKTGFYLILAVYETRA